MQEFSLKDEELFEKLLDELMNGPWHVNKCVKARFSLEEVEKSKDRKLASQVSLMYNSFIPNV